MQRYLVGQMSRIRPLLETQPSPTKIKTNNNKTNRTIQTTPIRVARIKVTRTKQETRIIRIRIAVRMRGRMQIKRETAVKVRTLTSKALVLETLIRLIRS